jgi:hypothetical protein
MSKITDCQRSLKIIIEILTNDELFSIAERLREEDWTWQAFLLEQEIIRRERYGET